VRSLVAALLFVALPAYAGPRAKSVAECMVLADLALVASTLAKHGIGRDKTDTMLPDMYDLTRPEARELARQIVDVAYRPNPDAEPKGFAVTVGNVCVRSGGRVDAILGVRL